MSQIIAVKAREILDSRGNPTIEADVITQQGVLGRAAVPSGASIGSREAVELRDGDKQRYLGMGVQNAVSNVNTEIVSAIKGMDIADQSGIDQTMIDLDGTDNKGRLGANSLLAVSLATAKAAAIEANRSLFRYLQPQGPYQLPVPMMNIINGGEHADNNIDLQEFMIIPVGTEDLTEALRYGTEVFHVLKGILSAKGMNTAVGDEGGFAPDLSSNEEAIELILQAVDKAGLKAGEHIWLGLDVASSEFCENGIYTLASEKRRFDAVGFADYLQAWVDQYPIISIEDGMAEDDWDGWRCLTDRLGNRIQLVGDDLFVTNTGILKQGIGRQIANSILIKVNQTGTLSETLNAIRMATDADYTAVISHRSGETEDVTIADIAVGTSATQIKTGSLSRSERTAKYNQLLRIWEELGSEACYPGAAAFNLSGLQRR